jgi:hypothetical protein
MVDNGSALGFLVSAARLLMSQVSENRDMRVKKSEISISDCNIICFAMNTTQLACLLHCLPLTGSKKILTATATTHNYHTIIPHSRCKTLHPLLSHDAARQQQVRLPLC